jgi:predicted transcriptional regulator
MNPSASSLRLLSKEADFSSLDVANEIFHQIARVLPDDQEIYTVSADSLIRDVVLEMITRGFTCVPVLCPRGGVIGVFSFKSFSQALASQTHRDIMNDRCAPGELEVNEYMDEAHFVSPTAEMKSVIDDLSQQDVLLVGDRGKPIGVLTATDFLNYLYKVASPFVLLSEIELAIRALIASVFSKDELADAAKQASSERVKISERLEEMTFDNYKLLICNRHNWTAMSARLGSTRHRVSGKLNEMCHLRNQVFHFRSKLRINEYESLVGHRNWLLGWRDPQK